MKKLFIILSFSYCLVNTENQPITRSILYGRGNPVAIKADKGTLYAREDGNNTITRLYINIDGNKKWISVVTSE